MAVYPANPYSIGKDLVTILSGFYESWMYLNMSLRNRSTIVIFTRSQLKICLRSDSHCSLKVFIENFERMLSTRFSTLNS